MDNRDLARALRDATDDLQPRPGFADEVVTRSRRRRTRNRLTLASVAGATAIAVAAVVVAGTTPLSSPPPPGATTVAPAPRDDWRTRHVGGPRVDDSDFTTAALDAWHDGLRGGEYDQRPGAPHVYWAGSTPHGDAAIVVERVLVGPHEERLLTGVVANAPRGPEPRLLGVQVDDPGPAGHFLLPDDRTILTVAHPDGALWASPEIRYVREGSRRDWTPVPVRDGVGVLQLPEGTNPLNVRLVAGAPGTRPDPADAKLGGHLALVPTGDSGSPSRPLRRGLPWDGTTELGDDLSQLFDPADQFARTLRESGLLDPFSYRDERSPWLIATRVNGGVLIIGEEQELDHDAYLYAVAPGPDGRYVARRLHQAEPGAPLPVVHRLPDGYGWLVAAFGKTLSYRTSTTGAWSPGRPDVDLLPPEATQVRVDDEVVDLR